MVLGENTMFFLKKEDVSDFQSRCVIALFLDYNPDIRFLKYVGKNHFVGKTPKYGAGPIYLFNTPNKTKPLGTVYRYGTNSYKDGFNYEQFKDEFLERYSLFAHNPFDYIVNHFYSDNWEKKYNDLFVSRPPAGKDLEILYKYKSNPEIRKSDEKKNEPNPEEIFKNFVKGELSFVNPSICNDPFDCECEISLHDSVPNIIYKAMQKTKYGNASVNPVPIKKITETIENYCKENGDIHEVNKEFFKRLIDIIFDKYFESKDNKQAVVENCDMMASQIVSLKNNFRILCLTRNPQDILMWGYYGNSGKGICCGHKSEDINNGILKINSNHICVYGDIDYPSTDARPKLRANTKDMADDIMNYIIECTFTKYHNWQHEKEFRYLLMGEDFGVNNFITIASKTDRIYLGCNSDEVPLYKDLKMESSLYKLKMSPQKYELVSEE